MKQKSVENQNKQLKNLLKEALHHIETVDKRLSWNLASDYSPCQEASRKFIEKVKKNVQF